MTRKYQFTSKFCPGDCVLVGGEIDGIVERVIFARCMVRPIISVEWWRDGSVISREFHEDEVQAKEGDA